MKAACFAPQIKWFTALSVTGLLLVPLSLQAQISWTGEAAGDLDWSLSGNWSPAGSPEGQNVTFGNLGKGAENSASSQVRDDITISQLNFQHTGSGLSDWHVVQIDAGTTLTISDLSAPARSLTIGGQAGIAGERLTTQVAFTGGGALDIQQATADLHVGNTGSNSNSANNQGYATLNLSGLANFDATVNTFYIGYGRTSNGVVSLAKESRITANAVVVGDGGGSQIGGRSSALELGASTTLHTDTLKIAARANSEQNLASGSIGFQEDLEDASVSIRGKAGGNSRANIIVGDQGSDVVSNSIVQTAVLDLSGGSTDARVNQFFIGRARGSGTSAGLSAEVTLGEGSVDATEVRVGFLGGGASANAGEATATLNLLGGSLTAESLAIANNVASNGRQVLKGNMSVSGNASVTVTNGIILGGQSTTTTPNTVEASLEISGGVVSVGGDIAEGNNAALVSSELALKGGSLNLNGNAVRVDAFALESGRLQNLGEFNTGADLVKTSAGTVSLEGTLGYTGATVVSAGTLLVNGAITQSAQVSVQSGATLGGDGEIASAITTTVLSGGTLAPEGNALTLGALALESGSHFAVSLGGSALGEYDRLVADTISLDGANLQISLDYAPVQGDVFSLISTTGSSSISGTFATINGVAFDPQNRFVLEYASQVYEFELSYLGDGSDFFGGNDLVIRSIPEPGTGGLLLIGVAGLLGWRRRRANGVVK